MVDGRYVEHQQAGEYLRVLVDGEGRSTGTARAYAGRLGLYLTWAAAAGVRGNLPDRRGAGRVCSLAGAHSIA